MNSKSQKLKSPLGNYAQPTKSQFLPEYTNLEADIVRQSFETDRHFNKLPNHIQHRSVIENRITQMDFNRNSYIPSTLQTSLKDSGLFYHFDYIPSEYDRQFELRRNELEKSQNLSLNLHPSIFKVSSKLTLPHMSAKDAQKSPTGLEQSIRPSTAATYSYSRDEDIRYETNRQKELSYFRDEYDHSNPAVYRKLEKGLIFQSGGVSKSLTAPSVSSLQLCLSDLRSLVTPDWKECNISVEANCIIFTFNLFGEFSDIGILAYMNTLLLADVVIKYKLFKLKVWNLKIKNKLIFAMRPPWLKRDKDKMPSTQELKIGDWDFDINQSVDDEIRSILTKKYS